MPLELLLDVNPRHRALADQASDPSLGLVQRETVARVLSHLTPGQAEVVRAHVLEGKSTEQIARDWGVPKERVRGLYKRGMAKLRRCSDARELRGAA